MILKFIKKLSLVCCLLDFWSAFAQNVKVADALNFTSKFNAKCPIDFGIGLHAFNTNYISPTNTEYKKIKTCPSFFVAVRYNFLKLGKNAAFSLGGAGKFGYIKFSKTVTTTSGATGQNSSFLVQLPATLNFAYGAGSTRESVKNWGFLIGGGYALNYYANQIANTDEVFSASGGFAAPYLHLGFKFPIEGVVLGLEPSFSYVKGNWVGAFHIVIGLNYKVD